MEALKRKWKSSRGASILLALLFLLLCVMVGVSVIMAAASNGGKIRSNQEEQQRYLALSSALRLVCDELESMEYVGRYKYGYVEVYTLEYKGDDSDDKPIYEWEHTSNRHYYWQQPGLLRARDGVTVGVGAEKKWRLMDTIPFQHDLDAVFAENFVKDAIENQQSGEYKNEYCTALNDAELNHDRSPFELTLTPNISSGGDILNTEILLTASMNPGNGQITLTATFDDDNSYIMTAYLFCSESGDNSGISSNPKRNLLLSGAPADPVCVGVDGGPGSSPIDENKAKDYETEKKLVWTLSRMVKGKKEVTGP